jgi:hypothetical protein
MALGTSGRMSSRPSLMVYSQAIKRFPRDTANMPLNSGIPPGIWISVKAYMCDGTCE